MNAEQTPYCHPVQAKYSSVCGAADAACTSMNSYFYHPVKPGPFKAMVVIVIPPSELTKSPQGWGRPVWRGCPADTHMRLAIFQREQGPAGLWPEGKLPFCLIRASPDPSPGTVFWESLRIKTRPILHYFPCVLHRPTLAREKHCLKLIKYHMLDC